MPLSLIKNWFGRSEKTDVRHRLGYEGERQAARYLKKNGFKILLHPYKCKYGEVDLVVREGDTLVFVEVKTRSSENYGNPSEAVDSDKQKHITRVALDYLRRLSNPSIPVRFDVVEVISSNSKMNCQHTRDAFPMTEPYLY